MRQPITDWDPENERFWQQRGRTVARRNLTWSIFAEFLGFSVWQLWSVVAVKLNDVGFDLTTGQLFWLVSIPGLVGATMRFPYTFGPAKLGGRTWTMISALLLLIPCGLLAVMVSNPGTPYWALLVAAATAGFGGGNFASSMANISFFYPEEKKGGALGLNAAGGNIGVAVVQKIVPLAIAVGAGGAALHLEYAGLIWVPFIMLAAWGAWRFMDNLAHVRSSFRDQIGVVRLPVTWLLTVLYIGAFGSFIGYSAAMPLLIDGQFPGYDPLTYAFLGPLVGSISRPVGGVLSDRWGGQRVTLVVFVGMAALVPLVIVALNAASFPLFLAVFLVLFVLSGMANGSVFKIVPSVFRRIYAGDRARALREGAAVLGFSSAVAAYGGFVIPQAFKQSIESTGEPNLAFYGFMAFYVLCIAITYFSFVLERRAGWSSQAVGRLAPSEAG